jgi:hypothetical protein
VKSTHEFARHELEEIRVQLEAALESGDYNQTVEHLVQAIDAIPWLENAIDRLAGVKQ